MAHHLALAEETSINLNTLMKLVNYLVDRLRTSSVAKSSSSVAAYTPNRRSPGMSSALMKSRTPSSARASDGSTELWTPVGLLESHVRANNHYILRTFSNCFQ